MLPAWLVRLPEAVIPPTAEVLDVVFAFVQNDLGLIHVTRSIAAGLEYCSMHGNILYGKNRFPYLNRISFLFIESLGPIPWSAVAAGMAVLGFWLGGWRMAILAGGTFVWTAMIGQWDIAMQTMSVLIVAAPIAFFIGLLVGIAAWQWRWVDNADQANPQRAADPAFLHLPFARGHLLQSRADRRSGGDNHLRDPADDPDDHAGPAEGQS